MHADQQRITAPLVRRLLARQFPQWTGLPLRRVRSAGTDHAIYRLGADLAVRLPLRASSAHQVEKEQAWLPRLGPHLPLTIPTPLGLGAPDAGYPFAWSVLRWLEGVTHSMARPTRDPATGAALGGFVAALRSVDPSGGPEPGARNFGRGSPLATRDERTRATIAELADEIDAAAATDVWMQGLSETHAEQLTWIHGDLCAGNLIFEAGQLVAVIDFGGLAVGDPAYDLIPAWNFLAGPARASFRAAVAPDPAAWTRGKALALSIALIQLPYYRVTNPRLAANAQMTIAAVLGDRSDG